MDEVGELLGEDAELVDDDHQPRYRGERGLVGPQPLVCLETRDSLGREQPFAPTQLRRQGRQRPGREVAVQVGDHAHHMRKAGAATERRPALVVDEQEGQLVRPVRQRQRADQGLQQLRLPGAGRPRDEGMRPVDGEVDHHRPVDGHAEDRRRRRADGRPARLHPSRVDLADEVEQPYRHGQLGRARRRQRVAQRGQRSRHAAHPLRPGKVGNQFDGGSVAGQPARPHPFSSGGQRQDGGARRRKLRG